MTANGTSSTTGRSNKSSKKSRLLVLKLPKTSLERFSPTSTPDPATETEVKTKASSPSSTSTPPVASNASPDNASEVGSTPPAGDVSMPAPPAETTTKGKGAKSGTKRGLNGDAGPKPRGKPGPKKRAKLEDGTTETNGPSRPSGTASHKLGPKANQGAINAGLRALDRTGTPTRKWHRKTFQLKSFTGVVWQVPSWTAPPKPKPTEQSSDKKETLTPSDDKTKDNNDTSAVPSEKSNAGESSSMPPPPAQSSPAPLVAAAS